MSSSNASSICRIDWRPSRALQASLIGLGLLSGMALLLSNLDAYLASATTLLCAATGLRSARAEGQRPKAHIIWAGRGEPALIESAGVRRELSAVSLHLRGPLAVLAGRDEEGRQHRFVFWPDTLDGAGRRALRLATSRAPAAPNAFAVALS